MPGGELEPNGGSGPALAEVAAELSEIFTRAGLGRPSPGVRRPASVSALRPNDGNEPGMTLLVAAAAAGLVGLGAGAFVFRTPGPPAPAASKAASPFRPPLRSPAAPPIALAETASAPTGQPTPGQEAPAAKNSPAAKGLYRAAHSSAEFRSKRAGPGGVEEAEARPPIRLGVPKLAAEPASCEQDPDGEDCRRAVIQADRHLRAVYQSAFERGVSRRVLVDYRDRWADLRERNNEDPVRLIESYSALAYDLRRETADDRDEATRPKSRSGLSALADLLLPWR